MEWMPGNCNTRALNGVLLAGFALLAVGCSTAEFHTRGEELKPPSHADQGIAPRPNDTDGAFGVDPAYLWATLETFVFEYDDASIHSVDASKVREISAYISHNPALRIAVDGSMNPRGLDAHNSGLQARRVSIIRDALIAAGVPAYIIEGGSVGRGRQHRDRSVEILVRTGG